MILRTGASLSLMAPAFILLEGTQVLIVLGAAVTVGDITGAWYVGKGLGSRLPPGDEPLIPPMIRAFGASVLMVGPAYYAATRLPMWLGSSLGHLFAVTAAGGFGIGIYVLLQRLWRSPELALLMSGFGNSSGTK